MDTNEASRNVPRLSIGMPVYNGERHIRQALDSLLAQDFTDLELVISDNASTDGTPQICEQYAAGDSRIRFYRNSENRGMTWNFNRVFELARGDFFMWAAHDDYHDPRYVRLCLQELERSADIVLCGSRIRYIDGTSGEEIFTNSGFSTAGLSAYRKLRFITRLDNMIGGIVYGIFRSSALRRVMPVKETFAADIVLLARLSLLGDFATVPETLMFERSGGASSDIKRYVAEIRASPAVPGNPYMDYFKNIRGVIFGTERLSAAGKTLLALHVMGDCCYQSLITWLYGILLGIFPGAALRVRDLWRRGRNSSRKAGEAGVWYRI